MKEPDRQTPAPAHAPAPSPLPPSERGPWLLAGSIGAIGLALLVAVLIGALGRTTSFAAPPIVIEAATPTPVASAPAARK